MARWSMRECYDALRELDPADLDFHAARYDSALLFQLLIKDARTTPLHKLCLWARVDGITDAGLWDGADAGTIPCLGGTPLAVWTNIREWRANYGWFHSWSAAQ